MRTHRIVYAAIVIAGFGTANSVLAQATMDHDKKEQVILVTGAGSVKYRPEGVKIAFGVRASDGAFATAWKDNLMQADKLRTSLEGLKVAGVQIKIAPPDIVLNDNLPNPGLVVPVGPAPGVKTYNVTRSFQVFIVDADMDQLHQKMLKIMETAVNHGANAAAVLPTNPNAFQGGFGGGFPQTTSITRVEFFHSNDARFRVQALEKAVAAALANARGVANAADVKIGKIVSISDPQEPNYGMGMPSFDSTQQDLNGEIELTVRVRVSVKF